jgi:hypothetical protein
VRSPLLLGHNPFGPKPALPAAGAHGWYRVHADGLVGPLLPVDRYAAGGEGGKTEGKTEAGDREL